MLSYAHCGFPSSIESCLKKGIGRWNRTNMKKVKRISIVGMLCALALIHYPLIVDRFRDLAPDLPFPGEGISVRGHFSIASAGSFKIEIVAAEAIDKTVSREDPSPVVCNLRVVIASEKGFRMERIISSLLWSGGMGAQRTDRYWSEGSIHLPLKGEYKIELSSSTDVPYFARHGAVVTLSRFPPRSKEEFIWRDIQKDLAYGILILSIIGIIISTWGKRESLNHLGL